MYAQDGFIHLTKNPKMLLEVANHFYTGHRLAITDTSHRTQSAPDVPGDFIVLCIDSSKLTNPVKFEDAANVGDKKTGGALTGEKFPHLVRSCCGYDARPGMPTSGKSDPKP
eukprot:9467898-Pyramimonas_sp.AAC.2